MNLDASVIGTIRGDAVLLAEMPEERWRWRDVDVSQSTLEKWKRRGLITEVIDGGDGNPNWYTVRDEVRERAEKRVNSRTHAFPCGCIAFVENGDTVVCKRHGREYGKAEAKVFLGITDPVA